MYKFCLILLLAIVAVGADNKVDPQPTPQPITSSEAPKPSPTDPTTTTQKPTPTTTTTTTQKPTTSSTTTTTTPAPITTTPPPITTTPAPITTTLSPITTTAAPAPAFGTWTITDDKNVTCIILQMNLQISVTCQHNMTNMTTDVKVPTSPKATTVSGGCGDISQKLSLAWSVNNATNQIDFVFSKNNSQFDLHSIHLNISSITHDDNSSIVGVLDHPLFTTPVDRSYKCVRQESYYLSKNNQNDTIALTFSDLHVQAFHNATNKDFSEADDCNQVETADIVPIAVGCALAGMAIVILLAYLFNRRRAQARGYLSMLLDDAKDPAQEEIPMRDISCFGRKS